MLQSVDRTGAAGGTTGRQEDTTAAVTAAPHSTSASAGGTTPSPALNNHIKQINAAFEAILGAANQALTASSASARTAVVNELGSKYEEFESACDDLYLLLEGTRNHLLKQEITAAASAAATTTIASQQLQPAAEGEGTESGEEVAQLPRPTGLLQAFEEQLDVAAKIREELSSFTDDLTSTLEPPMEQNGFLDD